MFWPGDSLVVNVYTYYEPGVPLSLWARSWKNRGWKPKILMPGAKKVRPTVSPWLINFSLRPTKTLAGKIKNFPATGPLVLFPDGMTEEQMVACGREI